MQRLLVSLAAFVALAAAVRVEAQPIKSVPIPAAAEPRTVAVANRLPVSGEMILDGVVLTNAGFIFKQVMGGSPAAGVLFGALGLLANEGAIKTETDAQAKTVAAFFLGIDLQSMLNAALAARQPDAVKGKLVLAPAEEPGAANRLALLPYSYVRVDREGVLRTTVSVQAELFGEPGKRTWLGRYHAHMPLMIKVDEVQAGDAGRKAEYVKALEQSMGEAADLFYRDAAGAVPAEGSYSDVISNYLINMDMRRVQVAMRGEVIQESDGRKIIRHDAPKNVLSSEVFGLHVFRDAQIMKVISLKK